MIKDAIFNIRAFDRTKQAFASVRKGLGDLDNGAKSIGHSFSGMKGYIAAALGGAAFKGIADAADHIKDLNTRLGISTEALSQFAHVADMSGVPFEVLTKGMQSAQKRISEAAMGMGKAQEAIAALGLSAEELNKLSPEQQFEVLAEAMQGVTVQADKVRIATKLFGDEGAALLQAMEGGSAGIRAMRMEADELGLTLTKVDAESIAAMNDSFDRLGNAIKGVATQLVAFLAPALKAIAEFMTNAFVGAINFVKKAFHAFVKFFQDAYKELVESILWLTEKLESLPGSVGKSMGKASEKLKEHAELFKDINSETDGLKTSQEKLNEEFKKTDDVLRSMKKGKKLAPDSEEGDENDKIAEKGKETMDQLARDSQAAAERLEDSFLDALTGAEGGFKGFRETAKSVLMDINKSMMKDALNQFGIGTGSAGGGIFGGLMSGITGLFSGGAGGAGGFASLLSSASSMFGGFFADGGTVRPGKAHIVGERSPEIFVPNTVGSIVPIAAGGGGNVNVSMNITSPDSKGFRQSQGQIAAEMARQIGRAKRNL